MNRAVDRLEKGMTESKINELVAKHYEAHSLLQGKLTSELDTIKEVQRREYREWLMEMLEQNQTNSSLPTPRYLPIKIISGTLQKKIFQFSHESCYSGNIHIKWLHTERSSKLSCIRRKLYYTLGISIKANA